MPGRPLDPRQKSPPAPPGTHRPPRRNEGRRTVLLAAGSSERHCSTRGSPVCLLVTRVIEKEEEEKEEGPSGSFSLGVAKGSGQKEKKKKGKNGPVSLNGTTRVLFVSRLIAVTRAGVWPRVWSGVTGSLALVQYA